MTSLARDTYGVKNFKRFTFEFLSYVLKVQNARYIILTAPIKLACSFHDVMSLVYAEVKNLKRFIFKFLSYVLKFQKSTLNIADGT